MVSIIYNQTKGLFTWEEIISVTENTFRQVYKQELALL